MHERIAEISENPDLISAVQLFVVLPIRYVTGDILKSYLCAAFRTGFGSSCRDERAGTVNTFPESHMAFRANIRLKGFRCGISAVCADPNLLFYFHFAKPRIGYELRFKFIKILRFLGCVSIFSLR